MHPAHDPNKFIVPRRDAAPDVGVVATAYTEPIKDEVTELAALRLEKMVERTTNLPMLVAFGLSVVALVERRAAADIADFARPAPTATKAELAPVEKRRIVAAELGRILDWVCKGRPVLDMGVRAAVVASHIRADAIDHRTDQQLALEIGNASRASVNKTKAEFRRALGADYAGENGKGSNTKTRCKNSRIEQLKS